MRCCLDNVVAMTTPKIPYASMLNRVNILLKTLCRRVLNQYMLMNIGHVHLKFIPPLCHSPRGSKICHQVNTHLHQADQNLTRLFLNKRSDKSEEVVCQILIFISFRVAINVG